MAMVSKREELMAAAQAKSADEGLGKRRRGGAAAFVDDAADEDDFGGMSQMLQSQGWDDNYEADYEEADGLDL